MSSTNRGGERAKDDFYETPEHCTAAILDCLYRDDDLPVPDIVFDPGAGKGAILKVARSYFPNAQLLGVEIDPEMAAHCRSQNFAVHDGDFLAEGWPIGFPSPVELRDKHVLVAGNPPYSLALPFIKRAIAALWECKTRHAMGSGVTLQLLRLNFAAAAKRRNFHHGHPADLYVLPGRPSFRTVVHHVYRCTSASCKQLTSVREDAPAPFCSHCGTATVFAKTRKVKNDSTEYAWWKWPGDGHWEVL